MAVLDKIKSRFSGQASGASSPATQGGGINKKAVLVGILLVIVVVAMVVLFIIESGEARKNKLYTAIAAELQVISQQIAVNALEAAAGQDKAFERLAFNQNRFQANLDKYDKGAQEQNLPALPAHFSFEFSNMKVVWDDYDKDIATVVAAKNSISTVSNFVTQINESLPQLISLSDGVVDNLVATNAPRKNIAVAARQVILIRSIEHSLNQILTDGELVMAVADRFATDAAQLEQQLLAMLEGNAKLGIAKFTGANVIGNLLQFADLYSVVRKNVREILDNSAQIFKVHEAALNIDQRSPLMLSAAGELIEAIERNDAEAKVNNLIGYVLGFVALLLLFWLIFLISNESKKSLAESQEQNEKNQRAILRLLDEMTNLADGDLSTHTTVTEDITGAIADSVNYSIDALRDLVDTINNTANQVRGAVRKTQNLTGELAEASDAQARQISEASGAVTEISKSMSKVSERASDSAEVARKSVSIAHKGGDATKQIEALVKTIQADTNEASVSMEQSTANVVKGAKLTENAGSALDRIEQVSMNLAQRILEISDATRDQAQESVQITESMDVIQEITAKTSKSSEHASSAIGDLSDMVKEMQTSMAGFKLPGIGSADSTMMQEPEDLAALGLNTEAAE